MDEDVWGEAMEGEKLREWKTGLEVDWEVQEGELRSLNRDKGT